MISRACVSRAVSNFTKLQKKTDDADCITGLFCDLPQVSRLTYWLP